VGGLFLAFPAIFPASATLVEKHEAENKKRRGLSGMVRGREAAALDAAGAAMYRADRVCGGGLAAPGVMFGGYRSGWGDGSMTMCGGLGLENSP
jgi:hypothetical protein